ncbi:MAG TPA: 4-hydroxy-tetrahydrodipicolinate reductase [Firmicutes bacterium]|nr:4-hydroxy-tetrahydrodipicolinate reductase [Bacillota bacterium]
MSIRVVVSGAHGKMGREVLKAVYKDTDLSLVGAVDLKGGDDVGDLIGVGKTGILVGTMLAKVIEETKPQVLIDFTRPETVMGNVRCAIALGVRPVVGTTGFSAADCEEVRALCAKHGVSALIAPNFAIGAILMMKMAVEAAKYLPHVEIIEFHHDQKLDAPSGTALRTAELIKEARQTIKQGHPAEVEKIPGARGGETDGMRIHSVRLPGYVAHQEVIFGGLGQTLSIRHDSISRESFMPGVVLAAKKVLYTTGLTVGLENLLD